MQHHKHFSTTTPGEDPTSSGQLRRGRTRARRDSTSRGRLQNSGGMAICLTCVSPASNQGHCSL